ncbi:MAG TPA: hypothetical protein VFV28_07090, partial [Limnobacter sp.]|nr:hypothetical protein [Limnobacter sp.]
GRAFLPLQLSPCCFIHSIEWVGQQDGVKQWQLHVGSSSVHQVGSTRHVIPLTEVFLPYWPDQAGARNFYGCVNKAQAALEIHLQRVSAAPRGDVVQPVLLSHRSDAIPMVLSMLNQLIASIRAGELEEGAQLAESAELVRAQLDGQLDRPALSDEGFRTALELAQTRLFSNPPVSSYLPSVACQTATLPAPTAYRQPNGDMHCGVTALNAYFQRPILSCGDAIHHLVNSYDEVYGIRSRGLDGLFSHRLLNGVERNQNMWISKQEFLGTGPSVPLHALEGICRDLSPRDQWNTLLNFSFPDAMANASRQGREQREAIDRLHITPGLWLTAFSGLNLDQLVGLANSILVHNHDMPEMASYPDRVEAYTLVPEKPEIRLGHAQAIHADEVEKILGQFRHSDSHGRQSPLPIICMSGAGGSNSVNHYFGILRDAHDRWINLGSDGTRITGQQACSVFAEPGGLAQALVKARVFKIVCPCLAGPHHNFHSLEKSDAHH